MNLGKTIVGIATLYRQAEFLFADITFTDNRFKILEDNNNRFNLGFSATIDYMDQENWKRMRLAEKISVIYKNEEDESK